MALMADNPTVVSMDATPLNFDSIGSPYDHKPSSLTPIESLKNALNRHTFNRARRLIMNEWGKDTLVKGYGINANKVVVIPPGVDLDKWKPVVGAGPRRPVRLLFVGGDFRRKGGDTLLQAFSSSLMQECELDIVTREHVDTQGLTGVRVHHGLGSNAPELMELYAHADIFAFPTQANVLPIVIMEAFASGLPVITPDVRAMREQVGDGVNGFLIPPADADALAQATLRLVKDPELRSRMSRAARTAAVEKYNASKNYPQVLSVCKQCVDSG